MKEGYHPDIQSEIKSKKKEYTEKEAREAMLELFAQGNKEKKQVLLDYWEFMDDDKEEAMDQFENKQRTEDEIMASLEEAQEYIDELVDNEIYPMVSIPNQYIDRVKKVQKGIMSKETDIPGVALVAGTLGILPFDPDADRTLFRIKCKQGDLKPRATGKQRNYNGVVVWKKDYIPLEDMEQIENDLVS